MGWVGSGCVGLGKCGLGCGVVALGWTEWRPTPPPPHSTPPPPEPHPLHRNLPTPPQFTLLHRNLPHRTSISLHPTLRRSTERGLGAEPGWRDVGRRGVNFTLTAECHRTPPHLTPPPHTPTHLTIPLHHTTQPAFTPHPTPPRRPHPTALYCWDGLRILQVHRDRCSASASGSGQQKVPASDARRTYGPWPE